MPKSVIAYRGGEKSPPDGAAHRARGVRRLGSRAGEAGCAEERDARPGAAQE